MKAISNQVAALEIMDQSTFVAEEQNNSSCLAKLLADSDSSIRPLSLTSTPKPPLVFDSNNLGNLNFERKPSDALFFGVNVSF